MLVRRAVNVFQSQCNYACERLGLLSMRMSYILQKGCLVNKKVAMVMTNQHELVQYLTCIQSLSNTLSWLQMNL